MSKFTSAEGVLVKSIVASLSIKRVPESEILSEVYKQTNKTLSTSGMYRIKKGIKRDSFKWYSRLRYGEYEYIHEFKERINEVLFLQKKHHQIVMRNEDGPQIQ